MPLARRGSERLSLPPKCRGRAAASPTVSQPHLDDALAPFLET
jgi:hypothetical protein